MLQFSPGTLSWLLPWITQYGDFALFFLLALGIVGLPIPEDSLIALSGFLIAKGKLALVPTVLAVLAGSMCGISLSYLIGHTIGYYLLRNYGRWIGLTEARINYVHAWYERFGKWTLFIGYFVAGVRHLTGYVAGSAHLSFKRFALFAYLGAVAWVGTLLSLGYFFGARWDQILTIIDKYMWSIGGVVIGLIILYIVWSRRKL